VPVLKDFQSLLRNIHLKDYLGERYWAGYCPLGKGKVDLPAVLERARESGRFAIRDGRTRRGGPGPMEPFECAKTARNIS